jgi:acyl-CoA thioester hydrolase
MAKPLLQPKGRLIKRKLSIQPAFHETDMMGVIHNSVYFLWFEQGRFQIMSEVLSMEESLKLGVLMPVVENICHYRKPATFGQPLLLYTKHYLAPAYEGRLVFSHYLIHEKQRTAIAYGQTAITLVDTHTKRLIKDWPDGVWGRYQALK